MKKIPNLRFQLLGVTAGVSSLVIHYRANFCPQVAEMLMVNDSGLVCRTVAHYHILPATI